MDSIETINPLYKVHYSKSAVNKSQQHQEFLGMPRIKPGAAGCEARTLSIVLCSPQLLKYFDILIASKEYVLHLQF